MKIELFNKAIDKIPNVVAQLAAYEEGKEEMILETVCEYSNHGTLWSKSSFVCSEPEMMDHLEQAKRRADCEIILPDYDDPKNDLYFSVKRTLNDGRYFIAEYKPTLI